MGLKDANGLELIKQIRAANPAGRVLIFTMHEEPELAARTMESGASGYVTKNEGPDVFLAAVSEVLEGGIYLSHALAQKIALLNIRAASHPLRELTAREVDVLRLLGEGKSANEIAAASSISYRTVANAISLIKRKLNAPTTGAHPHCDRAYEVRDVTFLPPPCQEPLFAPEWPQPGAHKNCFVNFCTLSVKNCNCHFIKSDLSFSGSMIRLR